MQQCTVCKELKEVSVFVKNRKVCKACNSLRKKQYYNDNKDYVKSKSSEYYKENKEYCDDRNKEYSKLNKQKLKVKNHERYLKNKTSISEKAKIRREKDKDKIKEYLLKNKDKRNENRRRYFKEQRQNNLQFKISTNLRSRLKQAIKCAKKRTSHVKDLGCSIEELILYIESKFYTNTITGEIMSWENWGRGVNHWQIDHIIEFRDIDVTDPEQLKNVVHYTNLQPLWFEDHVKKTNRQ